MSGSDLLAKQQSEAVVHPDAIGKYRVVSLIGEGGMGLVYKALDPGGEAVAVKLVKANLAGDATYRRRFDREALFAARVSHPAVVGVVDAGQHEGIPFIVQRFVEGRSLEQRIESDGPLAVEAAVRLCGEVAGGLEAIHAEGITHRDLKPGNVLIDEQGGAHITDFGLAKQRDASLLTMPGQALGSMDFMAPEQIRGEEVSATTDVYALGCLMFVCLAGEPPFADRQGMTILWAHLQDAPPDPCAKRSDVPPGLSAAVLQAMEKDAAKRPPSASEYARLVAEAAGLR
jgi:serine/threonine-protein kinase